MTRSRSVGRSSGNRDHWGGLVFRVHMNDDAASPSPQNLLCSCAQFWVFSFLFFFPSSYYFVLIFRCCQCPFVTETSLPRLYVLLLSLNTSEVSAQSPVGLTRKPGLPTRPVHVIQWNVILWKVLHVWENDLLHFSGTRCLLSWSWWLYWLPTWKWTGFRPGYIQPSQV